MIRLARGEEKIGRGGKSIGIQVKKFLMSQNPNPNRYSGQTAESGRYKNWCVTWHSTKPRGQKTELADGQVEIFREVFFQEATVRYSCFQVERVGEEGTAHIQGVVFFKSPTRMSTIKRKNSLFETMHLERARDPTAAAKYCKKENTRIDGPWEFGEYESRQGRRTDLEALKEAIQSGKANIKDIADDHFETMVKSFGNVKKLHALYDTPRKPKPVIIVSMTGPSGVGKTWSAREKVFAGYSKFWVTNYNTQFIFDGYNGEKVIVFDEFKGQIQMDVMNKLMDYGPFQANVKHSRVHIKARRFIFMSNHPLEEWYPNVKSDNPELASFYRRFCESGTNYKFVGETLSTIRNPEERRERFEALRWQEEEDEGDEVYDVELVGVPFEDTAQWHVSRMNFHV